MCELLIGFQDELMLMSNLSMVSIVIFVVSGILFIKKEISGKNFRIIVFAFTFVSFSIYLVRDYSFYCSPGFEF